MRQFSLLLFTLSISLMVLAPAFAPLANYFSKTNIELELAGEEEGETSKKEIEIKTLISTSNQIVQQFNQLCSIAFHEHIFSEGIALSEIVTPPPESI